MAAQLSFSISKRFQLLTPVLRKIRIQKTFRAFQFANIQRRRQTSCFHSKETDGLDTLRHYDAYEVMNMVQKGELTGREFYTAAMHRLTELGCMSDSIKIFKQMQNPDIVAFEAVIEACSCQVDGAYISQGEEFFNQMKSQNIEPTSKIISFMLRLYHKNAMKALDIFTQYYGNGSAPSCVLSALLSSCYKSGKFQSGIQFYQKARRNGDEITSDITTTAIQCFTSLEDFDNAQEAFEFFMLNSKTEDIYARGLCPHTAIMAALKFGRFEKAHKIFNKVKENVTWNFQHRHFLMEYFNVLEHERSVGDSNLLFRNCYDSKVLNELRKIGTCRDSEDPWGITNFENHTFGCARAALRYVLSEIYQRGKKDMDEYKYPLICELGKKGFAPFDGICSQLKEFDIPYSQKLTRIVVEGHHLQTFFQTYMKGTDE